MAFSRKMASSLPPAGEIGWRGILARCQLIGLLAMLILQSSVRANDGQETENGPAKQALVRQGFPWYDAKKDELIPLFPQKIEPPASHELNWSLGLGGVITILLWVVLALAIGAVILAVIWFGQSLLETEAPIQKTEADLDMETGRLEALPEPVRGKGDLLARARELAKARAFSEAIVFLHGWQLIQLDKQGKIELQKGKTNRQYQGELSSAPAELCQTFSQSTRLFEDAFYGHLEISEAEFQSVWSKNSLFEKTKLVKDEKTKPLKSKNPPRSQGPSQ